MIIIGLVAEMAGGKTAAAQYLQEKYQAKRYGFGIIIRDLVDRLHLAPTRESTSGISVVLRQKFGNDLLARAMAEDIKNDKESELVVVESIRREEDILFLKELKNFHLVSIKADPKIRYERLIKRKEKEDDATKTYEEFLKDHERETELSIIPLLDKAEFIVDNNGSQEYFEKQLDNIVSLIKE
jgi:dephospho-CoA kinase